MDDEWMMSTIQIRRSGTWPSIFAPKASAFVGLRRDKMTEQAARPSQEHCQGKWNNRVPNAIRTLEYHRAILFRHSAFILQHFLYGSSAALALLPAQTGSFGEKTERFRLSGQASSCDAHLLQPQAFT
jgi:hypothetical protein